MKLGSTEVAFKHLRNERLTTCNVVVKGKIYHGTARLSKKDNFCRDIGRKISLTKALSKTNEVLTKKQRTNVWSAYRDMPEIPRW